jgi:hypothetical protein
MSSTLPTSKVIRQSCIDQAVLDSRDALLRACFTLERIDQRLDRMDQRLAHMEEWCKQIESEISNVNI